MRDAAGPEWTARLRTRRSRRPQLVDVATMPRPVTDVAFDQFVLDAQGASWPGGESLVRGIGPDGTAVAIASVPWSGMPIVWTALQSRRAPDLLAIEDDEMEPVGHRRFDERFAVDADDVSEFRKRFRTSLRDWLVDADDEHGPLIVIFDGSADPAAGTPRRRATDAPAPDAGAAPDPDPRTVATVFVARPAGSADQVAATLDLAVEITARVRDGFERRS